MGLGGLADEEVFGFDVAVDHSILIHVVNRLDQLEYIPFDILLWEPMFMLFEDLQEILLDVLKDQVQPPSPKNITNLSETKLVKPTKSLLQVDDVLMLESLEHLDFTERDLPHPLVVVQFLKFLNCNFGGY